MTCELTDEFGARRFGVHGMTKCHTWQYFNLDSKTLTHAFCISLRLNVCCFISTSLGKLESLKSESYQISEIHSRHDRMIKRERDYLAIRSGSEPLCDICSGGGSHFHARGVELWSLLCFNTARSCEGMNEAKELVI